MKVNRKSIFSAMVAGVATVLVSGCACVSESVYGKSPLVDSDREMCLASSSGKDLEYWIDGNRLTEGCHWHLEHVKCQMGVCLYRCKETEAFWWLSKDGGSIKMKKDVKGTNFPQEYKFASARL